MFVIVISINCAIALTCLAAAWFLIKLKFTLANVTKSLEIVERQTHEVLAPAPQAILQGQQATRRSRQSYQNLEPNLQRAYQIISLLDRLLMVRSQPTQIWRLMRRNQTRR
jgi:hypothetical protein